MNRFITRMADYVQGRWGTPCPPVAAVPPAYVWVTGSPGEGLVLGVAATLEGAKAIAEDDWDGEQPLAWIRRLSDVHESLGWDYKIRRFEVGI